MAHPRVVFSTFPDSASWWQLAGQWRVRWPMQALQAQGYPVDFWPLPLFELLERILTLGAGRPDLVVLPQLFGPANEANRTPELIAWHIGLLQAAGCAVAADLQSYPRHGVERPSDANTALLYACDGFTVATSMLAEAVRQVARPDVPVVVVPNAIAPAAYLAAAVSRDRGAPPVSLGCAFTARSLDNLEVTGMAAAWGRLAERYPDVTFVVVGGNRPGEVTATLEAWGVPRDRLATAPLVDFDAYPEALAKIDIGCCPLTATPFNICKSPQKSWEHALTGAAVVCSPTVYGDDERLVERGGLIADGADEWYAHLSRLVEGEQERRDRVATLQRFVLDERSLEANVWRWPAAWQTIVRGSGRDDLALALLSHST